MLATPLLYDLALVTSLSFKIADCEVVYIGLLRTKKGHV